MRLGLGNHSMSKSINARAEQRCVLLEKIFDEFKAHSAAGPYMELDAYALYSAAVSYFEDVDRHKQFHGIERIEDVKQAGFTIKWLAKFRPIRFSCEGRGDEGASVFHRTFRHTVRTLVHEIWPEGSAGSALRREVLYTLRNRNLDERLLFIWLETLKRGINGDLLEHAY